MKVELLLKVIQIQSYLFRFNYFISKLSDCFVIKSTELRLGMKLKEPCHIFSDGIWTLPYAQF